MRRLTWLQDNDGSEDATEELRERVAVKSAGEIT